MKNKKTFSISGKSQLDGFTKYRNTSILFCILVILVFFLFFRSTAKENIYMEPQADALYLSSRTGEEIYISYDSISSVTLVNTFDFGFPKEGTDDKQIRCGLWENEALGCYQLFTLKNVSDCLVLTTESGTVVFNYESTFVTDSIYSSLRELLSEKGLAGQTTFRSYTEAAVQS